MHTYNTFWGHRRYVLKGPQFCHPGAGSGNIDFKLFIKKKKTHTKGSETNLDSPQHPHIFLPRRFRQRNLLQEGELRMSLPKDGKQRGFRQPKSEIPSVSLSCLPRTLLPAFPLPPIYCPFLLLNCKTLLPPLLLCSKISFTPSVVSLEFSRSYHAYVNLLCTCIKLPFSPVHLSLSIC